MVYPTKVISKNSPEKDHEYKQEISDLDKEAFFGELMIMYFFPFTLEVYENQIMTKLSEFPVLKEMRFDFNSPKRGVEGLERFVQMLKISGVVPYNNTISKDRKILKKGKTLKIFELSEDRLII